MMYLIKDMPTNERPRERLMLYGVKALSTYELIAIILRVGYGECSALDLAKRIVSMTNNLSELKEKTVSELSKIKGVGQTKAVTLLASIELGERVLKPNRDSYQIGSPKDVFELLRYDVQNLKQEVLIALYLDVKTCLIAKKKIFVGGLNQSLVHPREVFKYAVKYSAFALILVHNHPSGDPTPSKEDIKMTNNFSDAGAMLQIELLDHIIIANDKYLSITEYSQLDI